MVISEYIHYHAQNYVLPSIPIEVAKQKVMDKFISNFNESNVHNSTLEEKQIEELLNALSSDGIIGSSLTDILNQNLMEVDMFGLPTGAGLQQHVKKFTIPDKADVLAKELTRRLNLIIETLAKIKEPLLIAQLSAVRDGGEIPEDLTNQIPNGSIISQTNLSLNRLKLEKTAVRLRNIIRQLSEGVTDDLTIESIAKSAASCLSGIAGVLYEPAVSYLESCTDRVIKEECVDPINKSFLLQGAKIIGTDGNLGRETIEGVERKGDISATYQFGKVVVDIESSLKLRESNLSNVKSQISKKRLDVSKTISLGDFLDRGISLSMNEGMIEVFSDGYNGAIGAIVERHGRWDSPLSLSKDSPVSQNWKDLKEASKYAFLITLLATTSINSGDAVARMIINNKAYSMYAILKQLITNFESFAKMSGDGWKADLVGTRASLLGRVKEKAARLGPSYAEERVAETQKTLKRLYDKKVTMNVNFTNIKASTL